jgi:hypothetical protein
LWWLILAFVAGKNQQESKSSFCCLYLYQSILGRTVVSDISMRGLVLATLVRSQDDGRRL